MNGVRNTSASCLQIQQSFGQRNYWSWELICKSRRNGDLSDIRFFQSAGLMRSEHSALPARWLLCTPPRPLLAHSWSLRLVFRAARLFQGMCFQAPTLETLMSHFFSFAKHFLVNNACSPCKGHCWQGVKRLSCLVCCVNMCWPTVCVGSNSGTHNRRWDRLSGV